MKNNTKRVSLAPGSGGAGGYAHIGVIEALEKNGYKIEPILGSFRGHLLEGCDVYEPSEAYDMIESGRIIAREHLRESI